MAKRRTASKRRAKKVPKRRPNKVMSFHQAARRKRSAPQRDQPEPKGDRLQKAAYNAEVLEPDNLKEPTKASELPGNDPREDVSSLSMKMTKQFAEGTAKESTRAISIFIPPLANPLLTRNATVAITRELFGYVAQQVRLNLQSMNALPRSRSPQELLIVQGNFAKATSENIFEAASSIFRIASQMAAEVGRDRPRMGLAER